MLILSLCILTVIEASELTKGTGNEVSPVGVETGNMDSFDVSLFHDKDRISGQLLNTSNVDECKNFQLKANSSFADGSGNYTCVDIEIPKPVILIGKDALNIWCKPGIQYSEIISYKIKHHPLLGNKTDECEWIYHNNNKTIVSICTNVKIIVLWEPPLPLENATLHLKIDKINVTLYEAGNYSCWISAATEEKHIEAESSLKAVEVRKNPKPNPTIRVNGTKSVRPGIDDLEVSCSPRGRFDQILGYTVHKTSKIYNSSKEIVKIHYLVNQDKVVMTWIDRSIEDRGGRVTSGLLNSGKAWIQLIIPKENVTCATDTARYHCTTYGAIPPPGWNGDSYMNVDLRIEGVNMTQIINTAGETEKFAWTMFLAISGIVVVLVTVPILILNIFCCNFSSRRNKNMKDEGVQCDPPSEENYEEGAECRMERDEYYTRCHEYECLQKYQPESESHYEDF